MFDLFKRMLGSGPVYATLGNHDSYNQSVWGFALLILHFKYNITGHKTHLILWEELLRNNLAGEYRAFSLPTKLSIVY